MNIPAARKVLGVELTPLTKAELLEVIAQAAEEGRRWVKSWRLRLVSGRIHRKRLYLLILWLSPPLLG